MSASPTPLTIPTLTMLLVLSLIFDHETASQQLLLIVHQRITYKLCTLMHSCALTWATVLMDMVVSVSQLTGTGRSHLHSAQKANSIYREFTLPSDQDPFLSHLQRHGITCRLTFNGCPPSPPSSS